MGRHYIYTLIKYRNRDTPAPRTESELIDSAPWCFSNIDLWLYFPGNFGFSDGRSYPNKAFLSNNIPKGIFGVKDLSFKDCLKFSFTSKLVRVILSRFQACGRGRKVE
jgi:hypothetical protein